MTPVYLNPLPSSTNKDHDHDQDHHDDHFHLFLINSPTKTSLSSSISSTSTNHAHDPRQTHFTDLDDQHNKVGKSISTDGSSGSINPQLSSFVTLQDESSCKQDPDKLLLVQRNPSINVESPRWMSSKVRSMHKTISSSSSDREAADDDDYKPTAMKIKQSPRDDHTPHQHSTTHDHTNHFLKNSNNSTVIRVCSDCNTTTTPLWRSGPRGPKSLCNACGIRQRKARRAMAEAAAAVSGSDPAPAPAMRANNKAQNKDKKARTGLVASIKKQCKQVPDHTAGPSNSNPNKKLFFKDLALRLSNNSTFQRVFPRDEEEAAFLLMELSCGLAHT